jgi:hypothetical protein
MPQYLCLFLNHADEVFGSDVFGAGSDDEAISLARTIYNNGIGKGYELWRDESLIDTRVHGSPSH